MATATYLLFLIGIMGALDIALYHSISHGIRSHPDSRAELVTHCLRGPTYAALFILVPNFQMQGLFAWGLIGVFAFDVAISIWDFWLEQGSRRLLGGLPSGEYVLHILLAMVFGGFVMSCVGPLTQWIRGPNHLTYAPADVPLFVRGTMMVMAVLVLISGIQDGLAAWRLRTEPSRGLRPDGPCSQGVQATSVTRKSVEPWMRSVLNVAGIYNIAWGTFVVFFPEAPFRWAGMPVINYLEVWQCVGMIVGVYGVGYMIAARDPLRHWPIILVGLLGKVFGPIGMLFAVLQGRLPWAASLTCVTNDLIWWVPFAMMLRAAYVHWNMPLTKVAERVEA